MRLTRYHLFLFGGLFLMVMGPLAFTQPGPGGFGGPGGPGGPGGRGKGGFRMSPDMIFMFLSGGKDSFDVKTVQIRERPGGGGPTAQEQRDQMMAFLQKKGVNDGVMTKANYAEYFEQSVRPAMEERMKQWAEKKGQGGPGQDSRGPGPGQGQDSDAQAREAFKRFDKNNDGKLSVEEMQDARSMGSRIYDERGQWDRNKNGTIELDEFTEYLKNRNNQRNRDRQNQQQPAPEEDPIKKYEEEVRPVVYRFGKLPKELPTWFAELDSDKDGQVGLYEWKSGGKSITEFLALDHNGDGFITAEEILRDQRIAAVKAGKSASPGTGSAATVSVDKMDNPRGMGRGGPGGPGGMNPGGRGKGGRGKGGRGRGGMPAN